MKQPWNTPQVISLGSIASLTAQNFNKCGPNPDGGQPNIIGSLTPVPNFCTQGGG